MENLLESTKLILSSAVTDVTGVSAKAMLTELAARITAPHALTELAKGRLHKKLTALTAALTGTGTEHQRFSLAQQLEHIVFLDEQIQALSQEISRHLEGMSHPLADDDERAELSETETDPLLS